MEKLYGPMHVRESYPNYTVKTCKVKNFNDPYNASPTWPITPPEPQAPPQSKHRPKP